MVIRREVVLCAQIFAMDFSVLSENFAHPPVLFFFLGIIATLLRSDLHIPDQISRFLSIYLLFDIGFKGGQELFHSGYTHQMLGVMVACVACSFLLPFAVYPIMRRKLNSYNAGAIAASYGSVSAVTFATASAFLDAKGIAFSGYMVAGMAMMESPAIVSGLILIRKGIRKSGLTQTGNGSMKEVVRESLTNGSVLLLVGSLLIGMVTGNTGKQELEPFIDDIFKGMLSLYMLDMGILAGKRLGDLRRSGMYLSVFSLVYPAFGGLIGVGVSYFLGLNQGDALLFTMLLASASYIAVPAAMRMSVPQANIGILLPMTLGLTFTLNVTLGIPLFYMLIQMIW